MRRRRPPESASKKPAPCWTGSPSTSRSSGPPKEQPTTQAVEPRTAQNLPSRRGRYGHSRAQGRNRAAPRQAARRFGQDPRGQARGRLDGRTPSSRCATRTQSPTRPPSRRPPVRYRPRALAQRVCRDRTAVSPMPTAGSSSRAPWIWALGPRCDPDRTSSTPKATSGTSGHLHTRVRTRRAVGETTTGRTRCRPHQRPRRRPRPTRPNLRRGPQMHRLSHPQP